MAFSEVPGYEYVLELKTYARRLLHAPSRAIQIAGEAGAGKTQLCLQLLLQVFFRRFLCRRDSVSSSVPRRFERRSG